MRAGKILFNACMYSENPPGVGVNTREAYNALTGRLIEKNIEFKCYTYSKKDLKCQQNITIIKLPLIIEFFLKKFVSFHRLVWNIFYLPMIARKFDLVYSFTSHGSPFIKNQIITIHDLICFKFPDQNRFQYLYFKFILPHIIKSCKKIIVISEFTKNDVMKRYHVSSSKLEVIYCGHDHLNNLKFSSEEAFEKKVIELTLGKPFFITVGASYAHKNVDKIIEAMQILPDYLLIVTGPNRKYYNNLKVSTAHKKYRNIIFLNYVSDSFLKFLYKKCVANIYISSYEGFGSTPLEAAMNDKISIVSNKSVLPEIYGNSVVYVNPENLQDVEEALLSVTSSDFDAELYKSKFPQLINKYSWGNMASNIMRVIENFKK